MEKVSLEAQKKIITTYKVTRSMFIIEHRLLKETGASLVAFQKKAIATFLRGDCKVNPRLKIRAYTDPDYVRKTVREQIILTEAENEALEEVAADEKTTKTVVIFQAMLNFCEMQARLLWG